MAHIKRFLFWRHLRSEPTAHILYSKAGRLRASGRGLSLWFLPLSTSIAEVPCDDRDLPFLFHSRSGDFQDVTAQGTITFRVVDPERVAERIDFSLDPVLGFYSGDPLEQIAQRLSLVAQQHASSYLTHTPIREVLASGEVEVRERILAALASDEGLLELGIEVVSVRVAAVSPTAELEKALQTPMREAIQTDSDEAMFQRRALAVEKERAIQENELENQIELARREESLIAQRGSNEQRRATEAAGSSRIEAEAQASRSRLESTTRAEGIRLVEEARVESERNRIDIYRDLSGKVLMGLAAQEMAKKLERIDHLNLSPEMFGPLLTDLIEAGTRRLTDEGEDPRRN